MKKRKNLFIMALMFVVFFVGIHGVRAADKSTLTCTYASDTNSGEQMVVEYNTTLKEFNVYKNNTISTNQQEVFDIMFKKSDFSIKNAMIDCNKNPILYEYIVIESGKKIYAVGDASFSYGPWNDGVRQGFAILNKYNIVDKPEGGNDFVAGSCMYKNADKSKSINFSLDESGKFNIKVNTGEKELSFNASDELKQMILQQKCYDMAFFIDNSWWKGDKVWFADSVESLREVYTGDITFEATLYSTNFDKTADELKQEVEELTPELEQQFIEIEGLIAQHKSNNCEENSGTEICKNLYTQITQKMNVIKPKVEKLENNPYTNAFYEGNEILSKYNSIITSLGEYGFTQYAGKDLTCDSIKRFSTLLIQLLELLRIAGAVLFVGLGIADFAKATMSGEQDLLKKASSNFIKRGIALVILFLLPIVLNLILKLAGISTNPLCGIGL